MIEKIDRKDLKKILDVQLKCLYEEKPTGVDWIRQLKKTTSINEATETFLVKFEGATPALNILSNKILFYAPYKDYNEDRYYQETADRRKYANEIYNDLKSK